MVVEYGRGERRVKTEPAGVRAAEEGMDEMESCLSSREPGVETEERREEEVL